MYSPVPYGYERDGGHPGPGEGRTEDSRTDAIPQKPGPELCLDRQLPDGPGIPTKNGGQWHPATVRGMVKRYYSVLHGVVSAQENNVKARP